MVRFKVGGSDINTSNLTVVWPSNSWLGLSSNATTKPKVDALNAQIISAGGCGRLIQPTGGVLPANAEVILVTGSSLNTTLNTFGAITQDIYIIFQKDQTTGSGHFSNYGTPATRTLKISFGTCSDSVTYDRSLLVNINGTYGPSYGQTPPDPNAPLLNNGATVNFTASGTQTYINHGCVAPVNVFSVSAGISPANSCAGTTILLTGNAQGQQSVAWSDGTSGGSFSASNSLSTNYTISPSATGTITLTLTATNSCGTTKTSSIALNLNSSVTPTFNAIASVCQNSTPPLLPSSSTNSPSISGTWNSTVSTATVGSTTYTFTPSTGQCASSTTLDIIVNPKPILTINCGTPTASSVTFNWNSISDATSYSYTYTVDSGLPISGTVSSATTTLTINGLLQGQNVAISIAPVGSTCGSSASANCISSNCSSPTVNTVANIPVCANQTVNVPNFTSNTSGVTFNWAFSNTSTGNITTNGTGTIPSFTAANVTTQQISTITVTATDGICTGPAITFDIIVNPLPSVPTIITTVATCLADGSSIISNYNVANTYTFTPSGPTVGSGGLVSGMIVGTSYTVTSNDGSCTSLVSASFTNSAQLIAPVVPTIITTSATCFADGSSTISNYNVANTYAFSPSGPTIGAGGLVSGMTITTSYTVTSNNGSCTSVASSSFANAAQLTAPAVPTISTISATCLADGSSTISNYNAANTYAFSPSGPTIGASGLVSGMPIGTSYTVTSNNGSCTSVASASFTNAAQLTTPAVPTISTTSATCLADGSSTISNYNVLNSYTFTPSGPTVGAGGLVSGMTIGTSYTVTSNNGSCTSAASASFTNAAQLTAPAIPTINTTSATCLASGSSTISNYNVANTYAFSPSGPTVSAGGLVSGMTIGTSYTVTSNNGSCTSAASAFFTNVAQLTTPAVPMTSRVAATCIADGSSTINNYNAANTYAFTPSGPTVGAGGLVSGMTIATSYTVTSSNGSCTSVASASFTNAAQLTAPAVPTIITTAATCLADGSSTISNYNASNIYAFTPSGPLVGAGGLVSGMTIATSYTVTSSNGSCTSVASASFTNAAQLTAPAVPTISTTAATCSSAGITTISNYNASNIYAFTPSGPTVGAGGLVSGMTIATSYTVTSNNGSCTSAASATFTNAAQLVAITPTFTQVAPICQGTPSLNLPTLSNNGINGIWAPSFDNTTTTTYNFTPNSGQCAVAVPMTIIVNSSPVVTASPNNQTICTGQATGILLTSSIPGATLFNWTVATIGATGALAGSGNLISQVLTATGVTFGSVDYSVTPIANGCSGTPSIITVLVSPSPTVIATPSTQLICSGNAPNIILSSTLSGTVFNWNVVQTNVTGASAGSGNTINQILTTVGNRIGEAVYSVVPSLNGCQGTPILVTITVNPIPVATANPSLATICSGTATSIALTSNVAGATFSWAAIQSGVIGATSGIGNTIAQTLSTAGIVPGSVTYTISPIINGCAGLPITATVTVNPTPEVFGSAGTTICSGESSSILLSPNIPGTQFAWTAVQTNVLGAADGTGDTIDQILEAGAVAGTAVYTVTPTLNGCSGKSIKITINVNPAPAPAIAPGIICVDAAGTTLQTYTLDTNLSTTNYTFKWYWNSTLINGAVGSTYDATKEGNYSVIVTNKITGCVSKEVFATIIANNPATSLTAVVSDAFTQEATITASVQGGTGPFLYQIDGGEFQSSNEFTGLSNGMHTLTVKDVQGCTNLSIPVIVIDYPKYFTPNGDGYDDTWNIKGLNDQPNAKIFIYDRYGKLIKEISTVGSGWDGTYNGKALPATDYWFTVEYAENSINKLFKAHFSIKR
jgi:gliding motility-associated-like protein